MREDEECDDDGNSETNLLELLNGTLVDTTALVDQVAGLQTLSACRASQGEGVRVLTVVDLPESTWPMTTTLM